MGETIDWVSSFQKTVERYSKEQNLQTKMAATKEFFASGSAEQFKFVLAKYDEALWLKAKSKSSGNPDNMVKQDRWHQVELPKLLQSRGESNCHLTHQELVDIMKWQLARRKYQSNMLNLIRMNTPRMVMTETKKAFRNLFKRNNVATATQVLCGLKGVGPTMASAILTAAAPNMAPFMSDEVLSAMPEEDMEHTMKDYLKLVDFVGQCVSRLQAESSADEWTPRKVEMVIWSHHVISDLKPELLTAMPEKVDCPEPVTSSADDQEEPEEDATAADPNLPSTTSIEDGAPTSDIESASVTSSSSSPPSSDESSTSSCKRRSLEDEDSQEPSSKRFKRKLSSEVIRNC